MWSIKKLNNFGDTIIEVLLAIAILSVVLAGAFAITNRSYTNINQAQEHTEALKYAQEQAERLKQVADNEGKDITGASIYSSAGYCLNVVTILGVNGLRIDPPLSCSFGTSPNTYKVAINPTNLVGSTSYNFNINVGWNGIHGGTDKVTLNYRLDK